MNSETRKADDRESRLEQVLADYLHAAEAGNPPDRQALLERHPELADDLRSFFANRSALEQLVDRKLTVRTSAYTARFFDLAPLAWPADDVMKVSELLCGHRIDRYGTLVPLSSDEVRSAWNDLWPQYLKQQSAVTSP